MYRILTILTVRMICVLKSQVSGKLTSDGLLSEGVVSDIDTYVSAVDSPILVYRGFVIEVPCLVNDKHKGSKNSTSYVWYDNENNTVSPLLGVKTQFNIAVCLSGRFIL